MSQSSLLLLDQPSTGSVQANLLLAHGAGAPMDSDFMQQLVAELVKHDLRVLRFEFPYMQARRNQGQRRPPNPMPELQQYMLDELARQMQHFSEPWLLAGKSMGGRVASRVVSQSKALGAIAYGYPFHPIGKPDKLRMEHLPGLTKPLRVIQGERDRLGAKTLIAAMDLGDKVSIDWLVAADHDLKPLQRSGLTQAQHLQRAAAVSSEFIQRCIKNNKTNKQ